LDRPELLNLLVGFGFGRHQCTATAYYHCSSKRAPSSNLIFLP